MSAATPPDVESLLAHRAWVAGLARSLVGDGPDADDLAQDAWVAALRSPPRDAGAVKGWFRTVAANLVRKRHRGDVRRDVRERAGARAEAIPSSADLVDEADAQRAAVQAVVELDEPYREALLLRYFEGLPLADLAARTGVPLETARSRVKRGLERVRERLDADRGGRRAAWAAPLAASTARRGTGAGPGAAHSARRGTALGSCAVVGGVVMAKSKIAAAIALVALLLAGIGWSVVAGRAGNPDPQVPGRAESANAGSSASKGARAAPRAERPGSRAEVPTEDAAPAASADLRPESAPTETPAKPDDARTLRGRVIDDADQPVAGARVSIVGFTFRPETRSAPDGTFSIIVPPPETPPDPTRALLVDARDHLARRLSLESFAGDVVVRTPRTVPIAVRVVDAKGAPAAGITVAVRTQDYPDWDARVANTGQDGSSRIHAAPRGATLQVTALRNAPRESASAPVVVGEGASVEVRLRGVRQIRATFTRGDGAVPIGHVEVESPSQGRTYVAWHGAEAAVLDLPPDTTRVRAIFATGASPWKALAADAEAVEFGSAPEPSRWVVLDGVPPEGNRAYMYVISTMADDPSDRLGSFAWSGAIPFERFRRGDGYALPIVNGLIHSVLLGGTQNRIVTSLVGDRVDLAASEPRVPAVATVRGRDGKPIEGATVVARPARGGTGFSDEERKGAHRGGGAYALELIPGLPYRIDASAPGHAPENADLTTTSGGESVALTLAAASPVRLRIPGLDSSAQVRGILFPAVAEVQPKVRDGGLVEIDAPATGWLLLFASRALLVRLDTIDRTAIVDVPAAKSSVAVTCDDAGAGVFLAGLDEIQPGIRAAGITGQIAAPPGRYLPFVVTATDVLVLEPIDIAQPSAAISIPGPADRAAWTSGAVPEAGGGLAVVVVATASGGRAVLPLFARPGATKTWRSVRAEIVVVPAASPIPK